MTAGNAAGEPLAVFRGGIPALYSTLGAVFHLERIEPADAGRIDCVNDLVWSWFGTRLRMTALSCAPGLEPTRRAHLDYIATYPSQLDAPVVDDPATQLLANNCVKFGRNEYEVFCNGADDPRAASPFSLRFWAEIGPVSATDTRLPAYSVLHLTVPDTWPIDDFYQRVLAVGSALRLRWGAAGYSYSMWSVHQPALMERKSYAHARRHPGYDVARYVTMMEAFYARLRTVGWLTFLGEGMVDELARLGRPLAAVPGVTIVRAGDATVLRAGSSPARGDVNRLDIPAVYRAADALVRPLRARDGRGLNFLNPWNESAITEWLRRFEPLPS
ncbi:type VI immunity family protein [Sorangium cellulosum]|uniref:DUF3396 domain-containing protein n=1 Tax=Sorangium cellulosum TaxID=56 RepID=A0A150QSN8_SORCE|nr:type VI immunity family protein [Sorangium cellulosum]KYF70862.1 hypothetical protein BE15_30620 [Sorangium cellulosum]